ncbi:four helix bundle protein [Candidatus Wolfebacteria bacterium]|nr:four helix bundle protein [Candidatus Wolfebacteria bacterium]
MYKELYRIGKQLPKRERFGIHARAEDTLLSCLTLSIQSALASKQEKVALLRSLQIRLEVVKQFVRLEHELEVLPAERYWMIAGQLRDLSRETAGWYNYAKRSR